MKITISKLKLGIIGREGVKSFTADIMLNGKKVADCREDGNGGCLSIYPISGGYWKDSILGQMDTWCKANLPKWEAFDGDMVETDLEMHISNLVSNVETEKALARDMKKGICFKTKLSKNKNVAYDRIAWKGVNIEQMLSVPRDAALLQKTILEIQSKGDKILNTNFGKLQYLVK